MLRSLLYCLLGRASEINVRIRNEQDKPNRLFPHLMSLYVKRAKNTNRSAVAASVESFCQSRKQAGLYHLEDSVPCFQSTYTNGDISWDNLDRSSSLHNTQRRNRCSTGPTVKHRRVGNVNSRYRLQTRAWKVGGWISARRETRQLFLTYDFLRSIRRGLFLSISSASSRGHPGKIFFFLRKR